MIFLQFISGDLRCSNTNPDFQCFSLTQSVKCWQVCDGNADCSDRSDEAHCSENNINAESFECKSGHRTPSRASVCKGLAFCEDGSVIVQCFQCKDGPNQFPSQYINDGHKDCLDGSDEELFTCENSQKIPLHYRFYDGNNCEDGSDESC